MTDPSNPKPPTPKTPGSKTPKPPAKKASFWAWLAVGVVLFAVLFSSNQFMSNKKVTDITYSGTENSFIDMIEDNKVESITYEPVSGEITGKLKKEYKGTKEYKTDGPLENLNDSTLKLIKEKGVTYKYKKAKSNIFLDLIPYVLPLLLILGIFVYMAKRTQGQMGSVMNIGRSKAKIYSTENPKTTFKDVAGYEAVKQEITEVVDFLKNPLKFRDIGARIPRGVLLVGPPGTGKTLIARAVAGEAGVPFISVTGSDFMEMFVGVGASRVRDMFATARKSAPAIIFVDEIDSIGRKRGAGMGGGHDEREQTLNQMLSEMDGFEPTEGIVMMAATNRPDILDSALLRPGRFDRQIIVPLPTQEERSEILKVHFVGKKIGQDVSLDTLSRATPGMSGAELSNLVNEAALHAVRRGELEIHKEDFNSAIDRVLMGLRRPSILMNDREKALTAYHEGGHAILAYLCKNADPVHKVTILPTGMALGMTQQLPLEERHSYNRDYLDDELMVLLGGRGAERVVFNNVSTGAHNDLVRATELAHSMVKEWGMSDSIGPMAWGDSNMVFLGDDMMQSKGYSEEIAKMIDDEAQKILLLAEDRVTRVLTEYKKGLQAIGESLIENEEITGEEVARLVDEAMGTACANTVLASEVSIKK